MSGYAWTATRTCAECRREFSAYIAIASNAARVVYFRYEQTRCKECMK